jgi:hypothetical protein
MTVRLCTPAHPGAKETIFHAHQKVAHRAGPNVAIEPGNHNAQGPGLGPPFRSWHPLEVLHFSFRSVAQLRRKAVRDWRGWVRNPQGPTLHQVLAYEAWRDGRLEEYFDSFVVSDADLERGVAAGTLAVDTRLRDALRTIRGEDGGLQPPDHEPGQVLSFPRPDVTEDAAYAGEASVLVEIDGVVRAEYRVEALEERVAALERAPLSRLHRLATR